MNLNKQRSIHILKSSAALRVLRVYIIFPMFFSLFTISCSHSSDGQDQGNAKNPADEGMEVDNAKKTNSRKEIPQKDAHFIVNAAVEIMYATELEKLAMNRVKDTVFTNGVSSRLRADTLFLRDLTAFAASKNVDLPIVMDADHQKIYEEAEQVRNPAGFKSAYANRFREGAGNLQKLFEDRLNKSDDEAIKAYVQKQMPLVKQRMPVAPTTGSGKS